MDVTYLKNIKEPTFKFLDFLFRNLIFKEDIPNNSNSTWVGFFDKSNDVILGTVFNENIYYFDGGYFRDFIGVFDLNLDEFRFILRLYVLEEYDLKITTII